MKRMWIAAFAVTSLVLAVAPAVAQVGGGRGGQNRMALVGDINLRFANQVIKEMGLTAEQVPRFRRVVVAWAEKRSALELEERRLRLALADEFRPGVAANPDSAARFVDALGANGVEIAATFRDEMKELIPVLTPVQRGQFMLARSRLLQRVKELQQKRPGGGGIQPR